MAKVIPTYKKSEKTIISNYRPISILPTVSKAIEKIVYSQINQYLTANKMLHPHQFGFSTKNSTESAVLYYLNHLNDKINMNYYCLTIFLDYSKAFDSISHRRFYNKLIGQFNLDTVIFV